MNHLSYSNADSSAPNGSVDLHGLSVSAAGQRILQCLEQAYHAKANSITLIHGHNEGTAIRSYIWQSIADNAWSAFVPSCSQNNLVDHLNLFDFDLRPISHRNEFHKPTFRGKGGMGAEEKRRGSETETRISANGYYPDFVFRSGRTTVPVVRNPS